MFDEMALKLYFIKCLERKISQYILLLRSTFFFFQKQPLINVFQKQPHVHLKNIEMFLEAATHKEILGAHFLSEAVVH